MKREASTFGGVFGGSLATGKKREIEIQIIIKKIMIKFGGQFDFLAHVILGIP